MAGGNSGKSGGIMCEAGAAQCARLVKARAPNLLAFDDVSQDTSRLWVSANLSSSFDARM